MKFLNNITFNILILSIAFLIVAKGYEIICRNKRNNNKKEKHEHTET